MKKEDKIIRLLKLLLATISLSIIFVGCTPTVEPSLTEKAGDPGVPAEITKVTPTSGYSGVTIITIDGKNFAPIAEDNSVYFGPAKAEVLSASETKLVVKAPIIIRDSLLIQISKPNVEAYNSDSTLFNLTSAVNKYYPFLDNQEPYVATSDKDGNLYFSYIEKAKGMGVYKISTDGTLSEFAPKGGETTFNDLKYHSDGYLIGVYGNKAIFKIEEGVKPKVFVNTKQNSIKLNAFDFDKDKTIWAGGKGGKIVSAKPDKSFKLFDYDQNIAGLRVFNNYLYAISGEPNKQNIVKFPIVSPDSIGAVETVFTFSANVEFGVLANSLTFDEDGVMYIATSPLSADTDPIDPIMFFNATDGSFGTWYPGLLESAISSFTWSSGTNLFVIQDRYPLDRETKPTFNQTIIKIDMERLGAPEFGKD